MSVGYFSEDTIAAISSGKGGALTLIRMSGPQALWVLEKLKNPILQTEGHAKTKPLLPKEVGLSSFFLPNGDPLDEGLVVFFKGPSSFTGEDVVELSLHGGGYLAERMMETLSYWGIRFALPGEFSFRSVRNGKMSVFQAHAIHDLIEASNDEAIRLALEKLSGKQNPLLAQLQTDIRQLVALGELGIDFSDQDVEEVSLPALKKRLSGVQRRLEVLRGSYERGQRIQEGICLSLIGLPNAGKSSFFNTLLGENRSIVSEQPGTTRDVVSEKLTLRSGSFQSGRQRTLSLRLEDTAGLRSSDDSLEKLGMERSLQAVQKADLILFLVDVSSLALPEQRDGILTQWAQLQKQVSSPLEQKTIGIFTKSDLLPAGSVLKDLLLDLPLAILPSQWILTSSFSQVGFEEAVQAIFNFSDHWVQPTSGEILLTRLEHFKAVNDAIEAIQETFLNTFELDLFASDMRSLLQILNPLIGETLMDDILADIFSQFCIGK